jgi:hypothetical protein
MMKEPIEADFDLKVDGAIVEVMFKPTGSHFTYNSADFADDPRDKTPVTIIASATGDTYWSNMVEATARRLAANVRPWRRRRKVLIGAAIGAGFGLIYTILVIDHTPDGMYVPQTIAGVVVAHAIELSGWALFGAAIGFFVSIAMTKTSKAVLGAAIGAGFGLVLILFFVAIGVAPEPAAELGLGLCLPWALIFAAIGFFTGRRTRDSATS